MLQRRLASLVVTAGMTVSPTVTVQLHHAHLLVRHAQYAVEDLIAGPDFGSAALALERYRAIAGTYAGAEIADRNMSLGWGTEVAYCVEGVGASGAVAHLVGPGGHVSSGHCPRL
ncbi:MAG TPA: hypothetical protein VMT74_09565 [Gaiellaceae bacterium]|nr:hypothetical protein [Gaiellaceae bacterium]